MKVHLGVNNCYAVKRWPEPDVWGKHVAERWGLKYVQHTFDLLDPRCMEGARDVMCEEIRSAADKYDFEVHSYFTGLASYTYNLFLHPFIEFRQDALRWCELACVVAGKLGTQTVGGAHSGASMESVRDPETREYLLRNFVESQKSFARYGAVHGQKYILWDPTPPTREMCYTIEDAKKIYERFNDNIPIPVEFCLDVGHMCGCEQCGLDNDPYVWLEELGRYSPVVHVQQTDGQYDRHWPFSEEYNQQGIIKMDKVLEALDKSGTKEVFVFLEAMHPFEIEENKVLADLDESFEYLKQFI